MKAENQPIQNNKPGSPSPSLNGKSAEKLPIEITDVTIHKEGHQDEYAAWVFLYIDGRKFFPGIETAHFNYAAKDFLGTDEEYDRKKLLPVGIGGGRFDDHGDKRKDSAVTLVTKYIGVRDNEYYKRLIDEIHLCDTKPFAKPTQMSSIIKMINRLHPNDTTHKVRDLVYYYIQAIIGHAKKEKYNYLPPAKTKTILTLFERLVNSDPEKSFCPDEGVRKQIAGLLQDSMNDMKKGERRRLTEVAYVVECLYRANYDEEKIILPNVEMILSGMIHEQTEFMEERNRLKDLKPVLVKQNRGRDLKLLVCRGDSLLSQKAARSLHYDLVLIRKYSGNHQIFCDNRFTKNIKLRNIIRMIRWLELPVNAKDRYTWEELGKRGTLPGIEHWYYAERGEWIANGTETHDARASSLHLQSIIDAMQHGFCYEGIRTWCNRVGITMNPKHEEVEKETSAEETPQADAEPSSLDANELPINNMADLDQIMDDPSTLDSVTQSENAASIEPAPGSETAPEIAVESVPQSQSE